MKFFEIRKESKAIAREIIFLHKGPLQQRKPYIQALHKGEVINLSGFGVSLDTWCYLVWKYVDNPCYKDEPLVKVIPRFDLNFKQIVKILEAQSWIYI